MSDRRICWITGVLLFQLFFVLVVFANPSHKVLDAPLAAHGKETSAPWHKEASSLYETARKKLVAFLEKEQNGAIRTISAEDLGQTHLTVTMIGRGGSWLQIWGEPSGYDFELRAGVMHGHLARIIGASQAFPATQKYMANFRDFIAKTGPARAKALTNLEKLCNERNWPAAEKLLFKVYDTLEPGAVFLSQQEKEAIYKPFTQVDVAIVNAMLELRSVLAEQELTKSIRDLTPDFAALQQEIQTAVESVAGMGSATWRGEAVMGPQLVDKIAQTWRETQVQAHQCRGKQWARTFRTGSRPSSIASDPAETQGTDIISNTYSAFSDAVMKSLTRLVEADGTRVSGDAVRSLYVEYLRALAPLIRQTNQRQWTTQLETALAKFSGKVPQFDQEIKSYAAATADLLRWRSRAAAAQSASKLAEFAPIEERFRAGAMSGKVNDVEYIGLLSPQSGIELQPQLLANSADIMPIAVQRLMGQKTSVRDVVRISNDSKAAIARYSQRTYANLPAPIDMAGEVTSLKLDLMVSEQAPPLTLTTMAAVVTAERGDLIVAGGEITGTHLEGLVTRFATLPASAVVLTELGRLPPEKFDGGNLHNMLMRFDISPQWACHDYFFVNLVPPANLTAAK